MIKNIFKITGHGVNVPDLYKNNSIFVYKSQSAKIALAMSEDGVVPLDHRLIRAFGVGVKMPRCAP
jgi:hypothetical protein